MHSSIHDECSCQNVEETIQQILELEENGCELIRIAVLDEEDARAIPDIKKAFTSLLLQIFTSIIVLH